MNKDLDERLIPDGQYVDALNIDVEATEGQDSGAAKNKLGNTIVADIGTVSGEDATDARTIGAVEYEALNKIYWFVACDTFDGIYEYDEESGTTTRVLQSNKATPTTESKLNFRKEYSITGVNFIKGPEDQNYLYWTDDYNPPRRINIGRAKSYAVDDVRIDDDISVILEPPLFAPSIETYVDATINDSNNMSEKFLYFAYRYKYVDDQYSSMSPFSSVAFRPDEYEYDYGVGNNKSMTNKFNSVRITVETGNQFVKEIQVLVRDTRNINVGIIDSFSKSKLAIADDSSYVVSFNNNKVYAALPNDQVTRLYDNVPLLAKAQDMIGNRLSYGNYVQFRNITNCDNQEILIDYRLTLPEPLAVATESDPQPTWRSDRDYEVGLVYLDKYGRMTTVLNASNPNYNSIYIPASNSSTANTINLTINSKPPCWATHYRVYVKQSKKSYYNVFPILSYADGLFKYFLINESDLNKIKVGEYVIFKATSAGPTNSNKKYKILEIESKTAGFLSGAIAGLYFKIKVDNSTELSGSGVDVYTSIGTGGGATGGGTTLPFINPITPAPFITNEGITGPIGWVENPIFYGDGDPSGISIPNTSGYTHGVYYNPDNEDTRITIQIDSPTTYSVYKNSINVYTQQNNNALIQSNQAISPGVTTSIAFGYFSVIFNQSTYNVGDRWVFNCRIESSRLYNEMGNISNSGFVIPNKCAAIVPGQSWSETTPETDRKIFTGAIIEMQIVEDTFNPSGNSQALIPFPPSPQTYDNIEEWWYESGARNLFVYYNTYGVNIKGSRVRFRRGKSWQLQGGTNTTFDSNTIEAQASNLTGSQYPVRMVIFSSVPTNPANDNSYAANLYGDNNPLTADNKQNKLVVNFKITQQENLNICETVPVEEDADIYHESFQTYPIENGLHKVLWAYDDYEFNAGNTQLRQFDKTVPHYFNVGDSIDVSTTTPGLSGTWNVTAVPDLYTVVTDAPFPGAGPATPGTVSLNGTAEFDQTNTQPAVIQLNKPMSANSEFNAWCWGNGLESDRIYDDFNETRKDLSPRVQVPIEDYKQIRNEASICYSGVFRDNSSLNRLNEFNLSLSNFKYLERDFGSIQKLYATDTNLYVFQENKVSQVLYGKNILFDSIGGGQVVSIPEVLGTQVPMNGEWGISKHPESFAKWGTDVYFADQRRGVVLQMVGEQILEISSLGMTDYFRDLMKDNPNTQKLGAYDPHNNMYVLASNDQRSIPCVLTIAPKKRSVPKDGPLGYFMFTITTDVSWTITLINTGYGTSWVTDYPTSGNGSQDIYATIAQNATVNNRTVEFEVEYCDGLTETFTLTQARGKRGKPVVLVLSNKDIR
jgi:hypothetical protein